MDLYDLMKAGSLIFSRSPARDMALVDALKQDREEKAKANRIREQIYGPDQSDRITWNGPRQMQNGNVTVLMDQQGPLPKPPADLAGRIFQPEALSMGRLPSIPKQAFVPEVRQDAMDERKEQLTGIPAYQKLAEQQLFTPPPVGKDRYLGTPGEGGVFDTVSRQVVGGTNMPKVPSEIQVALWQAENNPAKARELLNAKGLKGEWAINSANGKMEYVPESKLMSAPPGTYMRPPSGFKITSDGHGGFEVATGDMAGGAAGMTKPTQGKLEETLMKANEGYARLQAIQGQYKPEYQQLGTRWQSFATSWKDKAGMDVDPTARAQLQDYAAYRSGAIDNMTKYIQEVTGAAMGVQEGERITKGMPNPGQGLFDGDSPIEFEAKMNATMKRLGDVQKRMAYALKNGLTQQQMFAIPLESIPGLVDQRGDQMASEIKAQNPNMPPEQIKATVRSRLRQEFGLE
jgi:hypothetical protein